MPKHLLKTGHRDSVTNVLLIALLFRAYIPVGFMPASGAPFLLELCSVAAPLPTSMLMVGHQHHHHSGTPDRESCPFGSAPAAGPASHVVVFAPPGAIASRDLVAFQSLQFVVRLERAHPPRGPPAFTLS